MSRVLIVRPLAEADIERAYRWYEERSPGLGTEFVRAVDAALATIQREPELYPEVHHEVRRAALRRFPYNVFYVVQAERIQVIACMHARRNPRRWQSRRSRA